MTLKPKPVKMTADYWRRRVGELRAAERRAQRERIQRLARKIREALRKGA